MECIQGCMIVRTLPCILVILISLSISIWWQIIPQRTWLYCLLHAKTKGSTNALEGEFWLFVLSTKVWQLLRLVTGAVGEPVAVDSLWGCWFFYMDSFKVCSLLKHPSFNLHSVQEAWQLAVWNESNDRSLIKWNDGLELWTAVTEERIAIKYAAAWASVSGPFSLTIGHSLCESLCLHLNWMNFSTRSSSVFVPCLSFVLQVQSHPKNMFLV